MSQRTLRFCLLALLAFFATLPPSVAQESLPAYSEVCEHREASLVGTLRYCGSMDDSFLDFVETNVTEETDRLVVTSYGGKDEPTMRALEILNDQDVEIVVEGVCLSACAQFLFIPAKKARLPAGAVIALHNTSTAFRIMRLREDWSDFERLKSAIGDAETRERDFYRRHGLDEELLVMPMRAMRPVCVVEEIEWTDLDSGLPTIRYFAHRLWWFPPHDDLVQFGMSPRAGKWSTTVDEMMRIGETTKEFGLGRLLITDFGNRISTDDLANTPKCEFNSAEGK